MKFPSPLSRRLKVCFTDMFIEAWKKLKMLSRTKKALTVDVSSKSWLTTTWLFLESPNSPSSSLNAKSVSEFSFSCNESVPKVNMKSCKFPPTLSTTLSFLQRSSERRIVFCREKQHSLRSRTTFIPLPKCFMHLQCWGQICLCMPIFQKKSLSFPD